MREENFWGKKPRYSEVRVIARRVIARYDCTLVVMYTIVAKYFVACEIPILGHEKRQILLAKCLE